MTTFQIPATVDEAVGQVSIEWQIVTERGWRLAALIYGICEPQTSERHKSPRVGTFMSFRELERRLGGARSDASIADHWENWHKAIKDHGVAVPILGEMIDLPDETYPPTGHGGGTRDVFTAANPPEVKVKAMQKIMTKEPEVGKRMDDAFVQRAAHDHVLAGRVFRAYAEHNVTPDDEKKPAKLWADMGFGSSIYEKVRLGEKKLERYLLGVEANIDNPEMRNIVQTEIDSLEKAEGLIRRFADQLREAIGVDADAVFNRLVGR